MHVLLWRFKLQVILCMVLVNFFLQPMLLLNILNGYGRWTSILKEHNLSMGVVVQVTGSESKYEATPTSFKIFCVQTEQVKTAS